MSKRKNVSDIKPEDIAESPNYPHVNRLSTHLDVKKSQAEVKRSHVLPKDDVINLQDLNLQQFVKNLKIHVDSRPSWMLWLRKRNNEKIRIENVKIDLLIQNVEKLIRLGREVSNLQAEAILSGEILNYLVLSKQKEFETAIEVQVKKHLEAIHAIDHKIKMQGLEAEEKSVTINKIKEEIEMNKMFREEVKGLPPKEKAFVLGQWVNRFKDIEEDKDYFDKDHETQMQSQKLEQEEDKTDSLKVDKNFKEAKWEELKKKREKE